MAEREEPAEVDGFSSSGSSFRHILILLHILHVRELHCKKLIILLLYCFLCCFLTTVDVSVHSGSLAIGVKTNRIHGLCDSN